MWAFIKWLFESGMGIWNAPLDQFFGLFQGILQLAFTLLIMWVGIRLIWKAIKKLLTL
jgi:hypothetical protein